MTVPNSLSQLYSVLSSAKLHISDLIWKRNKSLIKMLKSNGPKTDPCGIAVMPRAKRTFQFFFYYYSDNQI